MMRNVRFNFLVLGADMAVFHLGLAFASQTTVIPAFAERLGAPNLVIGLIPALMTVGWTLPAIFAANYTQGLPRKLPFIVKYTVLERIAFPVMAVAAIWLAPSYPTATLVLMLAMLAIMTLGGGFLMPAWLDLIGKAIPVNLRGRYFGLSQGFGTLLGLGGSAGVAYLLDRYGFPFGYGLCFAAATVCVILSFAFLVLVREPVGEVAGRVPHADYLRGLPGLVSGNPNLRRFLAARALSVLGQMAAGFYTVYALRQLGAADYAVGVFTSISLASQTLGILAGGWLADRRGHVIVLTLGAAAAGLAAMAAVAAVDVVTLYPAFALAGIAQGAVTVSGMPIGLELGPEAERPTYIALNNSWVAPWALVGPLAAGLLADSVGYSALFVVAALFSVAATATYTLAVKDPRQLRRATA